MPTPAAWLATLESRLSAQQQAVQVYEDYYAGRHQLAFATAKFRQTFGNLFRSFSDNWCRTVVDAPVERLAIDGFRSADREANEDAWAIWQANGLDAESIMAHTEAVKCGRAYLMVSPGARDSETPRITVEHPAQVIVAHSAGDHRTREAALKKWRDEEGYEYATLYLPGAIQKWRTKEPTTITSTQARNWVPRPDDAGGANPLGVVPIVPLYNNPSMLFGGQSDLEPAIPLQDAINKELMDMLVASEFAAFAQRVLIGVDVPDDPDNPGQPDPNFEPKASVSRLLALEDPNAKIDQFAASDLNNYVSAVTLLLQHLAAQTRTPPHYLLGQIVNASGDALKAAETGLVAKVKRKQIDFADSWEEAMRLALKLKGRSGSESAETIWRDPEYRSEGELVDAATKLRGIGVPLEAIWERIGATPQQIEEWKTLTGLPDRPPPGATTAQVAPPAQDLVPAPPPSPTAFVPREQP